MSVTDPGSSGPAPGPSGSLGSLGSPPSSAPPPPRGVEIEPPAAAAVFGDRLQVARGYVRMLASDGVLRGLIGPRETDRLWTRHVLNCAALVDLLPPHARVVDVGSGAGLPGVVLAIARPDCPVVLVEPLERRVRFLDEVVDRLEVANCVVRRCRAQDAPPDVRDADVVVSRAVAPWGTLAGWCAGLARPGGTILALKGSTAHDEVRRDRADMAAAGLRDVSVMRLDGPAGPTFVVRATRDPERRDRIRRPARRRRRGVPTRSNRRSSDGA